MTIHIITDLYGLNVQDVKPFFNLEYALKYFIQVAKKYGVEYDFDSVIDNPSKEMIEKMCEETTAILNQQDEGCEIHWHEEIIPDLTLSELNNAIISDPQNDCLVEVWKEIKYKYSDAIVFLKQLDFYITVNDDAVIASGILGTLLAMKRFDKKPSMYQTTNVPVYDFGDALKKLLRAGYKVAIKDCL